MEGEKRYIRDGRAPIPEKELTSKIMSSIKGKNTKPELKLRKALWHSGIKGYRLHWKNMPGRPDITFPGKKIAVFVNGCFWHRCPYCKPSKPKSNGGFWEKKFEKNISRDKEKINQLNEKGWQVLVVWECQIKQDLLGQVARVNLLLQKADQNQSFKHE